LIITAQTVDQNTNLGAAMHIGSKLSRGLHANEATDRKVLADLADQRGTRRFDRTVAHRQGRQGSHVGGVMRLRPAPRNLLASFRKSSFLATKSVSQLISIIAPIVPSSDKWMATTPFRGNPTGSLAGFGTKLDAQNFFGLAEIASGLGQSPLAFHHRRVGSFAQLFHHACGNFRHFHSPLAATRPAVPAAPHSTRSRQPA
jgi:hypothetical protein